MIVGVIAHLYLISALIGTRPARADMWQSKLDDPSLDYARQNAKAKSSFPRYANRNHNKKTKHNSTTFIHPTVVVASPILVRSDYFSSPSPILH